MISDDKIRRILDCNGDNPYGPNWTWDKDLVDGLRELQAYREFSKALEKELDVWCETVSKACDRIEQDTQEITRLVAEREAAYQEIREQKAEINRLYVALTAEKAYSHILRGRMARAKELL